MAPLVDASGVAGKCPGLVAGVTSPAGGLVIGVGTVKVGQSMPPGEDTIFEIGSNTKVFTGLLLAQAVTRGDVPLDGPVGPLLDVPPPSYAGQDITLEQLATHYSSLPDYPTNRVQSDPWWRPWASYTVELLDVFLQGYVLASRPGTAYLYSNLGNALLGRALVRRANVDSYATLIRRDITDPLAMPDTVIDPSPEQAARLASGHHAGSVVPGPFVSGALDAAGALRSTPRDMIRFIEAHQRPSADFASAVALQLLTRRPTPLGPIGLAIILDNSKSPPRYFKDGGTPGFGSFVLFSTEQPQIGVVLLCNSADPPAQSLADLANAIFEVAR
jgi:CubicO group peptidase (beta-lactamase class C family)